MRSIFYLLAVAATLVAVVKSNAQCTILGLQSSYCLGDPPDTISAIPPGGFFMGTGMTDSIFDPAAAGVGTYDIYYSDGTTNSYLVLQNGTFNPIPGSGISVMLSDDQVSTALNIGFAFSFFGLTYTQFYISSNGFITFDAAASNGCCSGQVLPNTFTPNNLIAMAWEDLNPSAGGTIDYFTTGTSPNQILVVNFTAVPHYPSGFNVTTQLQLHESTNIIEIHTTTMPTDGGSHTQGIENAPGSFAYTLPGRNGASFSMTNDYIAFVPACTNVQTTVQSAPIITTTQSSSSTGYICEGQSDVLTASGASTYIWSPATGLSATTGSTVTATPTDTITYTVASTDASTGCTTTENLTVNVVPLPVVDLGVDTTICYWNYLVLDAGPGDVGYTYQWNTGGADRYLSLNSINEGFGQHTYIVTKTDAYGCTSGDTINVNIVNCVGYPEFDDRFLIEMSPVPVNDMLHLDIFAKTAGDLSLQITDMFGRKVGHARFHLENGSNAYQVSFSKLPAGIYLIEGNLDSYRFTRKLIKQ